jgi:hypothetical protein
MKYFPNILSLLAGGLLVGNKFTIKKMGGWNGSIYYCFNAQEGPPQEHSK